MSKSITLTYGGYSATRQISSRTENDPTLYDNKLNILKQAFAETIVTNEWLDKGLITLENNCYRNDSGEPIKRIVRTKLSASLLHQLDHEINSIIPLVGIEH